MVTKTATNIRCNIFSFVVTFPYTYVNMFKRLILKTHNSV